MLTISIREGHINYSLCFNCLLVGIHNLMPQIEVSILPSIYIRLQHQFVSMFIKVLLCRVTIKIFFMNIMERICIHLAWVYCNKCSIPLTNTYKTLHEVLANLLLSGLRAICFTFVYFIYMSLIINFSKQILNIIVPNHLRISLIHSRFSQTNSRQICHSTCTLVLRCLKHMGMVQAVKNKVQPTKFYHITRHKLQEIQLLEVMQELREKLFQFKFCKHKSIKLIILS